MALHSHWAGTNERYQLERRWTESQRVLSPATERGVDELIRIPVVVHVVYHASQENISNNQIYSQIAALNRDFQLKNEDIVKLEKQPSHRALVGNPRIAFELAKRDPNGRSTSGITRTRTSIRAFPQRTEDNTDRTISIDRELKTAATGHVAWPRDQYLNIWVCNMGRRPQGYATFPGAARELDGVVIDYKCFGTVGTARRPFHKGRTAVHEIGHWLDLLHIWGNDSGDCSESDNIDDTPLQSGPTNDVPLQVPTVTCGNGPDGNMCRNYLDFVNDADMVMFTKGQVARMSETLTRARVALLSSPALQRPLSPSSVRRTGNHESTIFDGVTWVPTTEGSRVTRKCTHGK